MKLARVVVVAVALASCRGAEVPAVDAGSDALGASAYAELAWRVRCVESGGACSHPDHEVRGFDGEGDLRVQCSVVETTGVRTLTFTVTTDSTTGLTLMNVRFPHDGGAPLDTTGAVGAIEPSSMLFVGATGGDPPSVAQPCQIDVAFTDDASGPVVTGNLICAHMTPYAASMPFRELTGPGEGAVAAASAVHFVLRNCEN